MLVSTAMSKPAVPAVQMIQYGFDVNKADYDNRTALMLAVVGGHSAAVNTLLGAGADATIQDNLGSNALVEACRRGHEGLHPPPGGQWSQVGIPRPLHAQEVL